MSDDMLVAAFIAVQCGSDLRWCCENIGTAAVVVVAVAEDRRESRSLKLRVRLLRAKLVRALEEETKVRSVVQEVKLKSRSPYSGLGNG